MSMDLFFIKKIVKNCGIGRYLPQEQYPIRRGFLDDIFGLMHTLANRFV